MIYSHNTTSTMVPIPLVIVEGFLGGGSKAIWGDFERHLQGDCQRQVFFAKVGTISSLHDRACELFFDIMGGTVDYGEEHSRLHQHKRHGRTVFKGLYPQWSEEFPLHFFGHSMGGATITKLQHLLSKGVFGPGTHANMLLSVTSVSAPFRGTQLVYTLGESTDSAPLVRPLSVGDILSKLVHIGAYFSPVLPDSLDLWRLEVRSLAFHETSFANFLKQLWRSDLAQSRDVAPWDATFQAAEEREADLEGEPNAKTFYQSFTAIMTQKTTNSSFNWHSPAVKNVRSPLMWLLSRLAGSFDFGSLKPLPVFIRRECPSENIDLDSQKSLGEEFWANDGIVPLFSQWHPMNCSPQICRHLSEPQCTAHIEPGVWHVIQLSDTTHVSLVPLWFSTQQQHMFWKEYGQWLAEIDALHCNPV